MIFDCVTYKNEDIILELRLNTLNEFVDKFIIVEATKNHAGKPKKLNFDIKKFEKFQKKIRYIIVDDMPEKVNSFYYNRRWWHENIVRDIHQRNQIMKGLQDAHDDDLIIISDIDEINPDWFTSLSSVGICGATSTPLWLMELVSESIDKIKYKKHL